MFDVEDINENIADSGAESADLSPQDVPAEEQSLPDLGDEKPRRAVKNSLFTRDWFLMLALYAVTLTLHILMTQVTTMFNLTPDEYAVTGVAAWFNGLDWSKTVSAGGYYGYFQSLFYVPVFKMYSDPYMQYRAMLIINGIIMSFAPVIVYYLARRWFCVRKLSSVFIAVVCGLYPSYLLLTKYTWNETMCCILPWVFALLMYKSLKSHKQSGKNAVVMQQVWAILAGLTLMAAYATHGRMLALTAAGIVLELIVLFTMRRRLFSLVGFFSGCGVGFVVDKLLKDYFQSVLWLADQKDKASVNTIENMFSRISGIDSEELMRFPQTLVGHFFYFFSSTWGFGAICLVMIISGIVMYYVTRSRAKKGKPFETTPDGKAKTYISSNLAIFCWFAFLVMGAIFVVSVAFKATSTVFESRADTAIFGRYIETFFPIAIFAALVMIYRGRLSTGHCFAALLSAAGVFVLTELITVPVVLGNSGTTSNVVSAMILGITPLKLGEGLKDPMTQDTFIKIIAVVMALLLALTIVRLIRRKNKTLFNAVTIPLAALLLYSSLYCYDGYTVVQARNASYGAQYVSEALDMIKDFEYNDVAAFSMKSERYVKAQFLYPELDIRVVSSAKKLSALDKRPDFIISDREDNLNMWVDEVFLVGDINHNVHLYACSDDAKRWCREHDLPLNEQSAAVYTGEDIPATNSVTRGADGAALPAGSAVYTNYFLLYGAGSYTATITGENVDLLSVSLTSDKKTKDIPFEIVSSDSGEMTLEFSVTAKTENVQLKLTNRDGSAVTVSGLRLERGSAATIAKLPGVSGVTINIS